MPLSGPIQTRNIDLRSETLDGAQITEESIRKSVCDVVNVSLAIVSCSKGREAIHHVGTKMIRRSRSGLWAFDPNLHDMIDWVEVFIREVRTQFFSVVLERMPELLAKFTGEPWMVSGEDPLSVWEPHVAGHVSLEPLVRPLPVYVPGYLALH